MEVPLSAIPRGQIPAWPDFEPIDWPVAECTALAKRDMKAGETLGRIGTYDYPRLHDDPGRTPATRARCPWASAEAPEKVLKPIKAGEKLTYENCAPDEFVACHPRFAAGSTNPTRGSSSSG